MISKSIFIIPAALLLLICFAETATDQSSCGIIGSNGRKVSINIETIKGETGEWITTFSTLRNSSNAIKKVNLDIEHDIYECNGQQIIHIHGVVRDGVTDVSPEKHNDKLFLYVKASDNAIIKNNGHTIAKKDFGKTALALTSRPLNDNELLEVRVDKRNNKNTHAMGMGVTVNSPAVITVPDHMNSITNGTWMLYYSHLYQNATIVKSGYLQSFLNVEVGGLVGVMRKSSGALHFYLNGVDQGAAAINVPMSVYGAVELWGDAIEATIL